MPLFENIQYRPGSNAYVINNGLLCVPYPEDASLPEEIRAQYDALWAEVHAYALEHPGEVTEEQPWTPPAPTLEDAQRARLDAVETAYQAALTATLTMPAASPSPAEIALAVQDFSTEDAEGLADVRAILAARRDELRTAVEAAVSVEEVDAITVNYPV